MALDLLIRVTDRETGNLADMFTQLDMTPKELGNVNKLIEALFDGLDIDIVSGIE